MNRISNTIFFAKFLLLFYLIFCERDFIWPSFLLFSFVIFLYSSTPDITRRFNVSLLIMRVDSIVSFFPLRDDRTCAGPLRAHLQALQVPPFFLFLQCPSWIAQASKRHIRACNVPFSFCDIQIFFRAQFHWDYEDLNWQFILFC